MKRTVFVSSAAAVLLLGSGFVSPAMQSVLADVPLIGKAYQQFHDYVGQNLVAGQLVTELNEKASSNNLDVTATSVYFDGEQEETTIKYSLIDQKLTLDCSKSGKARDGVRNVRLEADEKLMKCIKILIRAIREVNKKEAE